MQIADANSFDPQKFDYYQDEANKSSQDISFTIQQYRLIFLNAVHLKFAPQKVVI